MKITDRTLNIAAKSFLIFSFLFLSDFASSAKAQTQFLNGTASLNCSGALIKLGNNPGHVYLLTNGHCYKDLLQEAFKTRNGQIVYNHIALTTPLQIRIYGSQGETQYLPFTEWTYATMLDTDIALLKSDLNEEEINRRGIRIFTLENRAVKPKEKVNVISGYWMSEQNCKVEEIIFSIKEFVWNWKNGFSLSANCNIKSGWSGSPIISNSGKIIGVLNTVNEKDLNNCSLNNPCESDENGKIRHRFNIGYAQQTANILSCIHPDGTFDLHLPECQLPKPQYEFLTLPQESVTAVSFQNVLDLINLRVTPHVLEKYGKHFLATGDWPKEYSKTSSGGSFYHPIQSGVSTPDSWGVHITGWLAREPKWTDDAIALTLCHELGHHIYGGSAEDKADHFAPTCLGWAWTDSENIEWSKNHRTTLNAEIINQCKKFDGENSVSFCLRTLSSLQAVEKFRAKVWKQYGLTETEIVKTLKERKEAVINGLLGNPFK